MSTFDTVQKFALEYGFKPRQAHPEFKSMHEFILPDESLVAIIEGYLKEVMGRSLNGNGIVICTNKRVIFYRKSILGTVTKEEYSIGHVSSASFRKGFLNASIEIRAGSSKAEIELCDKKEAEKFVNALLQVVHSKPPLTNTPAPGPNIADQLERLFDLKQKGVLTEDEFQAQKVKVLASN